MRSPIYAHFDLPRRPHEICMPIDGVIEHYPSRSAWPYVRRAGTTALQGVLVLALLDTTMALSEYRRNAPIVITYESPHYNKEIETYLPNTHTIFINGTGGDMSEEYAKTNVAQTEQYGRTHYLLYSQESIDSNAIADALYEKVAPANETGSVKLAIVAVSAGGSVAVKTGQILTEKHPNIHVALAIMDGAPTSEEDLLGPKKAVAKYAGHLTLGGRLCGPICRYGAETLSTMSQGKSINSVDELKLIAHKSGGIRTSLYVEQLDQMRDFNLQPDDTDYLRDSVVIYTAADGDTTVNNDSAYHHWQQIIPSIKKVGVTAPSHPVPHAAMNEFPQEYGLILVESYKAAGFLDLATAKRIAEERQKESTSFLAE